MSWQIWDLPVLWDIYRRSLGGLQNKRAWEHLQPLPLTELSVAQHVWQNASTAACREKDRHYRKETILHHWTLLSKADIGITAAACNNGLFVQTEYILSSTFTVHTRKLFCYCYYLPWLISFSKCPESGETEKSTAWHGRGFPPIMTPQDKFSSVWRRGGGRGNEYLQHKL